MNKLMYPMAVIVLGWSMQVSAQEQSQQPDDAEVTEATYMIGGLHCPPCTKTVEASLKKSRGIQSVKVDWKSKSARVTFDESILPAQQVADLIAATPHMMGGDMQYRGSLALSVPQLKDTKSAQMANESLSKVPGVSKVTTYPKQRVVAVAFSGRGKVTSEQLIAVLKEAGLEAETY